MSTYIPGPGEDGYAFRDEEAAAEALGYPPEVRDRSDLDDERADAYAELTDHVDANDDVRITEAEWQAIFLAARALREVGAGLGRTGAPTLAAESIRNAEVLETLGRRSIVLPDRNREPEQQVELER